jgi:hypothetical protein
MDTLSRGAMMIMAERHRQVAEKGYTAQHDDGHSDEELADVAQQVLLGYMYGPEGTDPDDFGIIAKRGDDPLRLLVIAGALVAAEIDRYLRSVEAQDTFPRAISPEGALLSSGDMENVVYGYVYGSNANAVSDARVQAILGELRTLRGEAHL